jgi:predicted GNAT family N-acyltransferase
MTDGYSIQNVMTAEQLVQLHELSQRMWWSIDRTKEDIATMLKHCLPFAVIDNNTQRLVGFARVLTDEIRYAYIYDVMTDESVRRKGIGKMVMLAILSHTNLSQVKYFELTCAPEMSGYYEQLGFSNNYENVIPMRLVKHL